MLLHPALSLQSKGGIKKRKIKGAVAPSSSILLPIPQNNSRSTLLFFWDSVPKRQPRKETQDRRLSKATSSKKEKVRGSVSSVVLKQEGGEGCSVCTRVQAGRCCIPEPRCILERAPLLPDGAGAAGWFQFSLLHL